MIDPELPQSNRLSRLGGGRVNPKPGDGREDHADFQRHVNAPLRDLAAKGCAALMNSFAVGMDQCASEHGTLWIQLTK